MFKFHAGARREGLARLAEQRKDHRLKRRKHVSCGHWCQRFLRQVAIAGMTVKHGQLYKIPAASKKYNSPQ